MTGGIQMSYAYDIPFRVDLDGKVALITGGSGVGLDFAASHYAKS